ncbi:hypothetical protein [Paracoccus marinaquae]|uniref:SRPBCC family protein n=1 Tax=Paracoccus marinaquae TaxID=2841926 RepID=A0ABS6AHX0_9RHOB|nr:hypothetical protein [Paracoccus marinaquae]MBU3030138.1 hypothetical protein [Paracoccus marinaquae]
MIRTVSLDTYLDARPGQVWDEVNRPRLLRFVAHPLIRFDPVDPAVFPDCWQDRDYLVAMSWRGILPLGRQTIRISRPPSRDGRRLLLDDGQSAMIRRWHHVVSVEAEGAGTRYRDRIEIEAGLLTPLIAFWARHFYAHRQRRWRSLVRAGFDYDRAESARP